ncbi:Imidazole glycerol phosphate synthase subunit HisF [Buchnera aphidicola (Neophyllaphis podocarpi)]|uniref:imidazole glycerol phosphate synthase subunit HisF n=1 Tax=Buchnera aphidicola TaxID=9 RepID=UPI003463AEB7
MLAKRIIPCLDVKDGLVVKGIKFKNHKVIGDILFLAENYSINGADELVFYDIAASADNKLLDKKWIYNISRLINIPFCVAGGIKSINDAALVLSLGADKISVNSPAIENPSLIYELSNHFGSQCVVIGIDVWFDKFDRKYFIYQYTGNENKMISTKLNVFDWIKKVQDLGAGEIVLNMMNQDGICQGYDIKFLNKIENICNVPLIASGGAGKNEHFYTLFNETGVSGALAASVFHNNIISINKLKSFLLSKGINIRLC